VLEALAQVPVLAHGLRLQRRATDRYTEKYGQQFHKEPSLLSSLEMKPNRMDDFLTRGPSWHLQSHRLGGTFEIFAHNTCCTEFGDTQDAKQLRKNPSEMRSPNKVIIVSFRGPHNPGTTLGTETALPEKSPGNKCAPRTPRLQSDLESDREPHSKTPGQYLAVTKLTLETESAKLLERIETANATIN
jgi:hypothetical protein